MPDYNHIQIEARGTTSIIRLVDPRVLDTLAVDELGQELLTYIHSASPLAIIVSFENVTRCSSSVINGLLKAMKAMRDNGGTMRLCEMRDNIHEAFEVCSVPLPIDNTLHEAIDACE